ncbi:TIR domain-containing protein [bacterium]|nr:TIR domain-containing protein [bacterium]
MVNYQNKTMTLQYDIFISYSHRDSQLANSIYSKLKGAGLRCFLAEKDISASELWEDKIREAIRSAQRILLLITPHSKDSHWVVAEAGAAWALGKQLIPALAYVEAKDLITPIASHQARLVHTPEQIESLVRELSADGSIVHGNITGQWRDPSDGDIAYLRQSGNQILGFYNLGRGNQKLGVYRGQIYNRVFDYHWRWLDGTYEGYGQMTLSPDGERLSGEWWFGKQKNKVEHVGYRRISDEMPSWLSENDFVDL